MQTRNQTETKWNTLQQCVLAAKKANQNLGWVGKIAAKRPREVLLRSVKTISELLHPGLPSKRDTWAYT